MAIGDFNDGHRIVEDLFVANVDSGGYFVPDIPPTNRVLRVPVHYKRRIPTIRPIASSASRTPSSSSKTA